MLLGLQHKMCAIEFNDINGCPFTEPQKLNSNYLHICICVCFILHICNTETGAEETCCLLHEFLYTVTHLRNTARHSTSF